MRSWASTECRGQEVHRGDNNIQLYTINAIDKAIEIGMGKRTNTILQSAFFKLADVMPIDDAINFMKQAAQKSYGKKGQDVVEMNWKAIDAGVDAIHKVEVPAEWANPEADPAPKALAGRPELVKQIREVMEPIARMDGDSLPVSSFLANANGEWEQGASAYEKRGTASPCLSGMLQSALAATSVLSSALTLPSVPSS